MKLRTFGYALLVAVAAVALAIGSASTGEAKGKKKAAAAAPASHPEICVAQWQPVCGQRGGMKFTYANSCSAEKDGAKVVSNKACAMKAAKKGGKAKKARKSGKKKAAKKM
jgi:hypothetical protein